MAEVWAVWGVSGGVEEDGCVGFLEEEGKGNGKGEREDGEERVRGNAEGGRCLTLDSDCREW